MQSAVDSRCDKTKHKWLSYLAYAIKDTFHRLSIGLTIVMWITWITVNYDYDYVNFGLRIAQLSMTDEIAVNRRVKLPDTATATDIEVYLYLDLWSILLQLILRTSFNANVIEWYLKWPFYFNCSFFFLAIYKLNL